MTSSFANFHHHIANRHCRHSVLIALLICLCGPAICHAETLLGDPALKTKIEARIHQQKASLGRSFTLFEYPVTIATSVPHILAISDDDQIWFSQSGGGFARNFIDTPPVGRIGRLD